MADIFGTTDVDEIPGTSEADLIKGLGGDDVLTGLAGEDTLVGGGGDDTVGGGADDDTLKGGGGGDMLSGDAGDDLLIGAGGADTLDGGDGSDEYRIVAADAAVADTFEDSGSSGTDTLDATRVLTLTLADDFGASSGIEVIDGHDVNLLTILGGLSAVTWDFTLMTLLNVKEIRGSILADSITGSGGADKIKGLGGDDTIVGGDGDDTLIGGGGADDITGGAGVDTLKGGGGDDVLDGGAGADKLNGGGGDDTLVYDAADTVQVDGKTGTDTLEVQGAAVSLDITGGPAGVTYKGLEVIDIGGSGANTLTVDLASLLLMSEETDTLRVLGDSNDAVITAGDIWTSAGTVVIDTVTYNVYTSGTGTLQVQQGVNQSQINKPGNDVPVAANDTAGVGENASVTTGNVLANDIDGDGDVLSVSPGNPTSTAGVSVTNNGNGTFTYAPTTQFDALTSGATTTDTFTYTVTDGNGGTDTATVTVTITGVNDAPVVSGDLAAAMNEGATYQITTADLGEADPDDSGTGLTYTVSAVTNGTVKLSGSTTTTFTAQDVAGGLVTFVHNGSETVSAGFNVSLADGGENGVAADTGAFSITVNAQNDTPELIAGGTVVYSMGGTAVALDADLTVSDPDATNLAGATITLDNEQDEDLLNFSTQNGISGVYNANTGVLALTGNATVAQYEAALQSITFSSGSIVQDDRAISITVTDGTATSSVASITVDISSVIQLSALDATNGFQFSGETATDTFGRVGAAGDFNNDGFDDYILGATGVDAVGSNSGASYLVRGEGGQSFSDFNVSMLNGVFGFQISGAADGDSSGYSVQGAGDVNGDGFDDIIIGARFADPNGNTSSGASYVVFGTSSSFASNFSVSLLDGSNGFRISGEAASDFSGHSVSGAGDVNGDGYADLLIGAYGADANSLADSGAVYVVFGKSDFSGTAGNLNLSALDGTNGFQVSGAVAGDRAGYAVSSAGDINGDGLADILIGAPFNASTGAAYVVFGQSSGFAANLDLSALSGASGIKLSGEGSFSRAGWSVDGLGDIDGDGYDDMVIGAWANAEAGSDAGAAYVIFGTASPTNLQLSALTGGNGFQITGETVGSRLGTDVSGAGDVNGDGFDDILVGAWRDSTNGTYSGAAYVVFGAAASFASAFSVSSLDGTNGIKFVGEAEGANAGKFVDGAGDVNGDGYDDIMIGATFASSLGGTKAGAAYVIFGDDFRDEVDGLTFFGGTQFDDLLVGSPITDTIDALGGNDIVSGAGGSDSLAGGAGNDLLAGGAGADTINGGDDNDRLLGDDGADTLDGGGGTDILVGGGDNDIFLFNDALNGTTNVDVIMDFAGAGSAALDLIHLDNAIFTVLTDGALGGGAFESGAGLSAAGTVSGRIIYNTTTGDLYYDSDGTGATAAIKFATIASDVDGLSAADFLVI